MKVYRKTLGEFLRSMGVREYRRKPSEIWESMEKDFGPDFGELSRKEVAYIAYDRGWDEGREHQEMCVKYWKYLKNE